VSAALLLVFILFFSGCYTLQQGAYLFGYLARAVPLEKLKDEDEFVRRVNNIRDFAMNDLGLRMSRNYTKYVHLDRDYLAAVVSACAPLSFERHTWWFPVVGAMPYKGFFNPRDAKKESDKLKAKGLDVWVRGVDAFSTLGFFRDPLYSYMKEYSEYALADLIIHELTHATIYVKGDSEFNETLADFIGTEGARLYIETLYGMDSDEYRSIEITAAERKTFIAYIKTIISGLQTIYSNDKFSDAEKFALKETTIANYQKEFETKYAELFSTDSYSGFSKLQLNNAYLDLYRLYNEDDSSLEELFISSGGNLREFIKLMKIKYKAR
jgi:predicted aminopeptidase